MAERWTKTFAESPVAFAPARAAEAFCEKAGLSVGRMDRWDYRGILLGYYDIAKWHNLSSDDIRGLHGVLSGDSRHGPMTLTLTDPAAIEAARRADELLSPTYDPKYSPT
jgi:hypothetical protein